MRERTAALAAAPAVHERSPMPAALLKKRVLEKTANVRCDQCSAGTLRLECPSLLVQRADACTFFIVEHRKAHGARHMVFCKFGRAAHVDHGIESGQIDHVFELPQQR
jgi:hypothetical protein